MIEMSQDQVRNLLKYIDSTQAEQVRKEIFSRLGHECLYATETCNWVRSFKGDVNAFLDRVNIQHKSAYWESLVFNEDGTELVLTGRPVSACACAFADGEDSPISLCNYCCKNFQRELFKLLLGRDVDVEITESYLKGGRRCSTVIRLR